MRKIKKINGYLVVKFNDREKREYDGTGLGEYGVIDAELYTGDLDIDRGAMEYDDADSLEVAVELARGLESEEDITDEPPTYTVVVETADRFIEEEVNPQLMIAGWENQLKTQIESKHYPDVDPRTAAHELYGFKVALNRAGLLEDGEVYILPDHFAPAMHEAPLPQNPEELLTHICDYICKERIPGRTQEKLDAICASCAVDRLYSEAEARQLRAREKALGNLNEYITQLSDPELLVGTAHRLEYGARQYLKALQTIGFLTDREITAFDIQIADAFKRWEDAPPPGLCCSYQDDGFNSVRMLGCDTLADISPHDFVETDTIHGCTVQVLKCQKCGHEIYAWSSEPDGPYYPGKSGPCPYSAGDLGRGSK